MASMQGADNHGFQDAEDDGGNNTNRRYSFPDLRISGDLTECNKRWDRFEKKKTKIISWSSQNTRFKTTRDITCKVFTIVIFFWVILFLIVTSKVSILSLASRLRTTMNSGSDNVPRIDVRWIWAAVLCITAPSGLTFLLSCWKILIKKKECCKCLPTLACVVTECLHSIGIFLLVFLVLPTLKPILGCLLMSAVGLIPSLMRAYVEWDTKCKRILCNTLNICAAVAYIAVLVVWCYVPYYPSFTKMTACLPCSILLISLKWWDNFTEPSENNQTACRHVSMISISRETSKHIALKDLVVSLVKVITTIIGTIVVYGYGENKKCIRTLFFLENGSSKCSVFGFLQLTTRVSDVEESCYANLPFLIAGFTICSGLVCYIISVASCKAHIQVPCFSLPIHISTPVTFGVLLLIYNFERAPFSICVFKDEMTANSVVNVMSDIETPIWVCSVLSWILFCLVSGHIWVPSEESMAKREKLFCKPMYCDVLLGESLALSRRRHVDIVYSQRTTERSSCDPAAFSVQPRVIVCTTMWHETEQEMGQVLKSIYRLDADCFVRRILNENSYHLEGKYVTNNLMPPLFTHANLYPKPQELIKRGLILIFELALYANIFVDDAFEESEDAQIRQINSWSKQLIRVVRNTHLFWREKNPSLGEPEKPDCYETPYGGKIVWKLPGGTTLSAHLKDKLEIRKKKRWSQVMYMYYLLGFRMSSDTEYNKRKNRSTFLLALDGDVDFQEEALRKLIDRMLRDPDVGAACGRIHPVGTGMGPILWYQKFEYAVSHWLQKAAEHVTGCVLCSPGCFSLYRASALMDKDVIRKYATPSTESKHFVQYDQGEDRWLCTLLLQRGHRIEYCAASDSYTFAPEGFGEFFNQRKRWSPSTMSNTVDLLMNWSHLTKKNNTISSLFLVYQTALMLCLLFTPGTIFLLILGAIHLAFPAIPTYGALIVNMIPVTAYIIICFNTETKTQIKVAGVLCVLYILSMMVVLVGLLLQAVRHGICSATSLFLITVIGIFFTTAVLHPQEFTCIFAGIIYFFFTPTMSMLLVIYSVCNLNNISWGTRENKLGGEQSNSAGGNEIQQSGSWLTNRKGFVSSFRRCFCFTPEESNVKILGKLDKLEKIVEQSQMQGAIVPTPTPVENRGTDWTDEGCFKAKHELSEEEEAFWKDILKMYLKPKQEGYNSQEYIKNDLKELRNRVCLLFLVANSLLVILVVILQMNPNFNLHLPCSSHQFENEDFEPISFTFMFVFGILLVIQFLAMLFHRAGTFLHILSATEIPNPFKRKKVKPTIPYVREDEPDGIFEDELTDDGIDGEAEVRIFKYLLLHDIMKLDSNIVDSRSESDDEEIPRFEKIRKRLYSDLSKEDNDTSSAQNISDIVKKTKTSVKCVNRFLEKVRNGKTNHRLDINQTSTQSADEWDGSSLEQVVNTSSAATSVDEIDGQTGYGIDPKWKIRKIEGSRVKGANANRRIRPILKNKVSPRSSSLINDSQTMADVHSPSKRLEVNIDDLTNETNL